MAKKELYKSPSGRAQTMPLIALSSFSAITSGVLMMAPAIAQQMALEWHAQPAEIGELFSAELGAMSLATVISWFWLSRINWRFVAFFACAIFIIGNLGSGFAPSWPLLVIMRFITALCSGTLMIITIASAAQTRNVQKSYSCWVLSQLLLGAVGFAVLPGIFAQAGLAGCYIALAFLAFLALPLIQYFPMFGAAGSERSGSAIATSKSLAVIRFMMMTLAILCVLLFYVGLSGVWTFVGDIGERARIPHTSQIFSLGTFVGVVSSALAGLFPRKLEKSILLTGYTMMGTSVLLFIGTPGLVRFVAAVLIFKFAWTFVLPWILSTVARHDITGRLMSSINLVIGGGFAIGPWLAGKIIQSNPENTIPLFITSFAMLVISLICLMIYRVLKPINKGDVI